MLGSSVRDLFCLLANCFLLFCSDLAVLIYVTLLADIQRPNCKLAQGRRGGDLLLFNPLLLYCFTLMLGLSNFNLKRGIDNPFHPPTARHCTCKDYYFRSWPSFLIESVNFASFRILFNTTLYALE